jgi:hypothetical protein
LRESLNELIDDQTARQPVRGVLLTHLSASHPMPSLAAESPSAHTPTGGFSRPPLGAGAPVSAVQDEPPISVRVAKGGTFGPNVKVTVTATRYLNGVILRWAPLDSVTRLACLPLSEPDRHAGHNESSIAGARDADGPRQGELVTWSAVDRQQHDPQPIDQALVGTH